jgi:hypothetical protein
MSVDCPVIDPLVWPLELVSQFVAFANPTSRYITEPRVHGALIAASALATPIFIVFRWPQTLTLFNAGLAVGYVILILLSSDGLPHQP